MRYYILHNTGGKEVIWTRNKEYSYVEDIPENSVPAVSFPSADRCYKVLSGFFGTRVSAKTAKKKGFRLVSQAGVPMRKKSGEFQKIVPKHCTDISRSPDTEERKLQFLKELNHPEEKKQESSPVPVADSPEVKPVKSNLSIKVKDSPFGIETADEVFSISMETIKHELKNLIEFIDSDELLARDEVRLNGLQSDILHAIEFGNFNVVDGYRHAKQLQKIRQIRRQVKNIRRLTKNCAQYQEEIQAVIDQIQSIQDQIYTPKFNPEFFEDAQEETEDQADKQIG